MNIFKSMHKIARKLSVLLMFAIAIPASAQFTADAHPASIEGESVSNQWFRTDRNSYVGIRLGLNVSSLVYMGMHGVPTDPMCGMNIGMVYGVEITNSMPLFFETGLFYSEKGAKINSTWDEQEISHRMKYLQIPFVIKYRTDLGLDDVAITPFAGGYFAFGIAGRTKYYQEKRSESTFRHNLFTNPDLGFRLGCGASYRNLYLELSYDIGMVNVARSDYGYYGYDDFDDQIRTGNFSATIGLDF
ncbi:MAG: PorT family protein [Paraprevotella sp.]|nr:PorT family protein [Paraprevotella sp.]